jgi:hypothetical protein
MRLNLSFHNFRQVLGKKLAQGFTSVRENTKVGLNNIVRDAAINMEEMLNER